MYAFSDHLSRYRCIANGTRNKWKGHGKKRDILLDVAGPSSRQPLIPGYHVECSIEEQQAARDPERLNCYAEMSQALQAEKGIRRAQAVTTHEFEKELLTKGFPGRPIQQLTRLFEQVRYGHQQLGDEAKQSAKESLREIIDFCRGQA